MSSRSENLWQALFVVIFIAALLFTIFGGFLVDEYKAVNTIKGIGFTDYEITGRDVVLVWLKGCSRDDQAQFSFTATNSQGQRITGYVCAGILKGGTLRFPE